MSDKQTTTDRALMPHERWADRGSVEVTAMDALCDDFINDAEFRRTLRDPSVADWFHDPGVEEALVRHARDVWALLPREGNHWPLRLLLDAFEAAINYVTVNFGGIAWEAGYAAAVEAYTGQAMVRRQLTPEERAERERAALAYLAAKDAPAAD
jgi:hypothetical protein